MSLDKLVDSTQLDADLTSVANAIRTKGGTSASLAFPADFVSAIAAISGGGGSSGVQYKGGTFTPTSTFSDAARHTITTVANVGFTPDVFILCITDRANLSGQESVLLFTVAAKNIGAANQGYRATARYANISNTVGGSVDNKLWSSRTATYLYCDGTNIQFYTASSYILVGNKEYSWHAFKFEEAAS